MYNTKEYFKVYLKGILYQVMRITSLYIGVFIITLDMAFDYISEGVNNG